MKLKMNATWLMNKLATAHSFITWATILILLCESFLLTVDGAGAGSCPEKCTCSRFNRRVSCIGKQLLEIPKDIPETVTELYLSQNKITNIEAKAFSMLKELKILSLKSNQIGDIESEALSGLSQLEILYLSSNRLKILDPDVFTGLIGLKKVYLTQNQLDKIPDLVSIRNITQLNLDSNKIQSASFPISFGDAGNLTSVNLAHNNITTLRTLDLQFLRKTKIAKLDFSNCGLKSVESGVFDNLKSLQSLVLSYNTQLALGSLSNITASLGNSTLNSLDLSQSVNNDLPVDIFSPLANVPLRTLSLNHIGATRLANGTFAPVKKLMNLYMSYSKLQSIEPDTLTGLHYLRSLDLSHSNLNTCPTYLPASLKKLDLNHNPQLKEMPDFIFSNNSDTEEINFSHCAVAGIQKKAFFGLRKVHLIDLSHNLLAENSIPIDSFKYLNTLIELDLSYNIISQISTESLIFQGLHKLKILRLNSNNCRYLPRDILHPLKDLRELYLQSNAFGDYISSDINGSFFSDQLSLNILQLSMNDIHVLNNKTFKNLSNLTSLWLTNNHLSSWDAGTFSKLSNLTVLDLSFNLISIIKEKDVQYFSDGVMVNLTGNPFNCWCDLRWFRNWFNDTNVIFSNNKTYTCQSPKQFQGMPFTNFNPLLIETKCNPPFLLYIIISIVCAVFIMMVLFIVVYVKRWSIVLRWYRLKNSCKHRRQRNGYREISDSEYHRNVVVSYGSDDAIICWVKSLVTKLENMEKTYFTQDNIDPGVPFLAELDMYYDYMHSCDYIIVALTEEYLNDGRKTDFELGLVFQSLHEQGQRRVNQIIPVLHGPNEAECRALWEKCPRVMKAEFPNGLADNRVLLYCVENEANNDLFWAKLAGVLNDQTNGTDENTIQ